MATPRAYDSGGLEWGLRVGISNKLPGVEMLCEPVPLSHSFMPIPGGDEAQILMEGLSL